MNIFKSLSIVVIVFCVACDKPLPSLEGVDVAAWQEDKNGCKDIRNSMMSQIDSEKNKLLALDQMQIVKLLGRPDQNELSSRNQKLFYYYIEAGPPCPNGKDSLATKLVIRFNAVGLAKEVGVVRGEW